MRNTDFNPIDTGPNPWRHRFSTLGTRCSGHSAAFMLMFMLLLANRSHQKQNLKRRWEGLVQTSRLAFDLAYVCKHDKRSKKRCFESPPRFSQSMVMTPLFISPTFTSLFSFLHFPKCLSVTPPLHPRQATAMYFALSCAFWCVGASSESEDQANVKRKSCSPDSST